MVNAVHQRAAAKGTEPYLIPEPINEGKGKSLLVAPSNPVVHKKISREMIVGARPRKHGNSGPPEIYPITSPLQARTPDIKPQSQSRSKRLQDKKGKLDVSKDGLQKQTLKNGEIHHLTAEDFSISRSSPCTTFMIERVLTKFKPSMSLDLPFLCYLTDLTEFFLSKSCATFLRSQLTDQQSRCLSLTGSSLASV